MGTLHSHLRNLPHIQRELSAHFITFCTRNRLQLSPLARNIAFWCCLHEHNSRAHVYAAVIMPDHVHLVLQTLQNEERREFVLSDIMQAIKGASAHKINRALGRKGPVWQEESFDHVIRNCENLNAKMAYVLNNPVRKGLVRHARDYRWVWTADPEFMANFLADD